jgi:D-cysteine desulfhydrase
VAPGVRLFVKRDDLTGSTLTGNKVRKLEFVLAEALDQGADTVITCGGAQSNHCRATAVAAAMLGLKSVLLLRTPDPASPPPLDGNSLLDRLVGAELVWITPEEYRRRGEIFEREALRLKQEGRKPYIIPEGASNALGAWGYIQAMAELAGDLPRLGIPTDERTTVVYACGSGGTGAGLILGKKLFGLGIRAMGVNVCDDRDYFVKAIGGIAEDAIRTYGLPVDFDRERDVWIADGYVGRGYALSRPEELTLLRDLARAEGLVLDPVYTGKAFYGLMGELAKDPARFGENIVFLHTGGLFGLFAQAAELRPLL